MKKIVKDNVTALPKEMEHPDPSNPTNRVSPVKNKKPPQDHLNEKRQKVLSHEIRKESKLNHSSYLEIATKQEELISERRKQEQRKSGGRKGSMSCNGIPERSQSPDMQRIQPKKPFKRSNSTSKLHDPIKKSEDCTITQFVTPKEFVSKISDEESSKKRPTAFKNRWEKLYAQGLETKQRIEKWANHEKERKKQIEEQELIFKPQINPTSKEITSRYSQSTSSLPWARLFYNKANTSTDSRVFRTKSDYEKSRYSECTFEPKLNEKTKEINTKMKKGEKEIPTYEALYMEAKKKKESQKNIDQADVNSKEKEISSENIHKRTLSREERDALIERLTYSYKSREQEVETVRQTLQEGMFSPKVNPSMDTPSNQEQGSSSHRSTGHSSVPVTERLYDQFIKNSQRRKQIMQEYEKMLQQKHNASFVTEESQKLLQSGRRKRIEMLFNTLKNLDTDLIPLDRDIDVKKLMEQRLPSAKVLSEITPMLKKEQEKETPYISFNDFYSLIEKNLNMDVLDQELKKEFGKKNPKDHNAEFKFKPSINKKSCMINSLENIKGMQRIQRLLAFQEIRENKIRKMREEKERSESVHLTFTPRITDIENKKKKKKKKKENNLQKGSSSENSNISPSEDQSDNPNGKS